MALGLNDRTALVTGAAAGIGRAVALRLGREGANVIVCAGDERPLLELCDEIADGGGAALAVPCDVTDPAAPSRALELAAPRFETVDILVNDAERPTPATLAETTDGDWITGLELNLLSVVRFTRRLLPGMVQRRWGRIVNVCSSAATHADPRFPIYGAAHAALVNFSRTVTAAHAADGVRCSCLRPEGPEEVADVIVQLASAGPDPVRRATRAVDDGPVPIHN